MCPIILTEMIVNNLLLDLDPIDIIVLLSMLIQDTKTIEQDDKTELLYDDDALSEKVKYVNKFINEKINKFIELEQSYNIYDSDKWDMPSEFIKPAKMWAEYKTIQQITNQTNIYEGTFVRNMLKISNIVSNIETLCKIHNSVELLPTLAKVNEIILRDIVTTSSLYI